MLYEDRLYGFAVAAMHRVMWDEGDAAEQALDIAEAMEDEFSKRIKARRDAALAPKPVEAAPAELPVCDWTAYGTPCGRPAVVTRVQRGLTRERPMCAAHESAGESLGYWLPKAAPERPGLAALGPPCIHCGHVATLHAVDDEERSGCLESCCPCVQYECAAVQP